MLATQNPIEQEGTYPLPEAQLDRFMFNIVVDYPSARTRRCAIVTQRPPGSRPDHAGARLHRAGDPQRFSRSCGGRGGGASRPLCAATSCDGDAPGEPGGASSSSRDWVQWGAGPRASHRLILAGKARALINGRYHVSVSDIQALARPVLRHRVIPNFFAESEHVTADVLVERLLDAVPTPRSGM